MYKFAVALFTRAWIEILRVVVFLLSYRVALFTRAWIEIIIPFSLPLIKNASPSLRGRGLKCFSILHWASDATVALFTRAWIEMTRHSPTPQAYPSPSLRGRGLKWHRCFLPCDMLQVALFTRAWIEIITSKLTDTLILVALFTRAWIEIFPQYPHRPFATRRPLYEGVD